MSPDASGEWLSKNQLPVYLGGAELNVANALANWKVPVKYFTALPDNAMSNAIVASQEANNIDCSSIHFSGNRIGIYYLTQGADLKNTGVIYDREHSSFADLKPGMINWNEVLADCDWFHFSAISPALNATVAGVCKEALEVAAKKGLTISVDLNYRSKLWQYGKMPATVMPELVNYCHIIMGNIWSVESLLGIPATLESSTGKPTAALVAAAKQSIDAVSAAYPAATTFAYTFRLSDSYFGVLQKDNTMFTSADYKINQVIDKVGSGDCFMAGLLYGFYNANPAANIVNFAAAAAVGKLYEIGDASKQTIQDVQQKMKHESTTYN